MQIYEEEKSMQKYGHKAMLKYWEYMRQVPLKCWEVLKIYQKSMGSTKKAMKK